MKNALLLVFCASTGCAIHSHTPHSTTAPSDSDLAATPPGQEPALVVRNASDRTICFVNFSASDEPTWGPERLTSAEPLSPGESRGWRVPANAYDLRVADCEESVIADNRSLAVAGTGVVVTYR